VVDRGLDLVTHVRAEPALLDVDRSSVVLCGVGLDVVAVGGEVVQRRAIDLAQLIPERDEERDPGAVLLEQRAKRDPLLHVGVVERVGETTPGGAHAVRHVRVRHERETAALRTREHVLDHVLLDRHARIMIVELEHLAPVARAIEPGVDTRVVDPRVRVDIDRAMDLAIVPVVERGVGLADVVVARDQQQEW